MEKIKFVYEFTNDEEEFDIDNKKIVVEKALETGLHDYDICEMFEDFMRSVGFSESNVWNYFST